VSRRIEWAIVIGDALMGVLVPWFACGPA
jgi:hypothetical protein